MARVFSQRLNLEALYRLQNVQYSEKLLMADTVPAGQSKLGKTAISNLGHFLCLQVTGHFQTVKAGGTGVPPANIVDDAVNHLRGQLVDGAGNRKLFNDYIPLDLWLSPGRERDNRATNVIAPDGAIITASAPYPLFYPMEFEYLFSANSEILLDVKNDSDKDISYEIAWHGIRVLSSLAVSGIAPRRTTAPARR